MTTDTTTDDRSTDPETTEAVHPWQEDGATLTDLVIGVHHENFDDRKRGVYPDGLDPDDYVDTLRKFGARTTQYLLVIGDLRGHAIYQMLNEDKPGAVQTMPWDEFIDRTALVRPDAAELRDQRDPAASVVRTDFDTLRARREQEVLTGCSCLPDEAEACHHCGGKKEA